jgi:hypothetical protein
MIELVFVVCLMTAPSECEERSLMTLPEVGLMKCMAQAQPQLAIWTQEHPNFRVARWFCRHSDAREQRA